ncbi:MAG: alkaline phosphatase family protein [Fidelibacterota bacterium]
MKKFLIFFITLFLAGCRQDAPPRLVVLISVDHLSHKAFTHYMPLFTGGFKWLRDHGVSFTETYHEHGYTATGPGHFVLGSGRYPGPAGVIGNSWYDREKKEKHYCVGDDQAKPLTIPSDPRSYRLVAATAIGDWLKATYPGSKVYSIAGKDRASVFMGGKHPDMALWYNWAGGFTTTDYYTDQIPSWLDAFNRDVNISSYRDSLWIKSLSNDLYLTYAREDFFDGETDNYMNAIYSPVFPIGFDSTYNDDMVLNYFAGTPWQERNTLQLGETIIREEQLGQDGEPDLLCIGLSATDWITHDYGPRSQEGMDNLIKIDRYLSHFLMTVDQLVGLENTVIVLTADHGGLELPEFIRQTTGQRAGRIDGHARDNAVKRAYDRIDAKFGHHDFIVSYGLGFYFDADMMEKENIDQDWISTVIREELVQVDGIEYVLNREDILNSTEKDTLLTRMKHFTHPVKSPDLWIVQEKHWVYRNPYGTSHGTPYDYDAHVPFLICQPGFEPRNISAHVPSVDIAVTIADILGITPDPKVDGISRKSSLQSP